MPDLRLAPTIQWPDGTGQPRNLVFLKVFCLEKQKDWAQFLPSAEYLQSSLKYSATQLTPFQCILEYQPPLFPWDDSPMKIPAIE